MSALSDELSSISERNQRLSKDAFQMEVVFITVTIFMIIIYKTDLIIRSEQLDISHTVFLSA